MDLKTKAIEKAARQLKNLGCEYMIVPDGRKDKALIHGVFTYHNKTSHGEYSRYVDGFLAKLRPGESVMIPVGDYPTESIASVASARAFRMFGKGNYITGRTNDLKHIEVLCLDVEDNLQQSIADLLSDMDEGED